MKTKTQKGVVYIFILFYVMEYKLRWICHWLTNLCRGIIKDKCIPEEYVITNLQGKLSVICMVTVYWFEG